MIFLMFSKNVIILLALNIHHTGRLFVKMIHYFDSNVETDIFFFFLNDRIVMIDKIDKKIDICSVHLSEFIFGATSMFTTKNG